jgi:guanyl-specific ribonuclease Sa
LAAMGVWQFQSPGNSTKTKQADQHVANQDSTATKTPPSNVAGGKSPEGASTDWEIAITPKSASKSSDSKQSGTAKTGNAKLGAAGGTGDKTTAPQIAASRKPSTASGNPQTLPQPPPAAQKTAPNVTLLDQDGDVIYQGPIDLQPTLDRIDKGERHRHRNDGSVFQNREKRLPRKENGYYREYVVPTPNENGPGPQRLILGSEGEVFYTSDHYKSFKRLNLKFTPKM